MVCEFLHDRFESLDTVQYDRLRKLFGQRQLLAEEPPLCLAVGRAGVVQPDLSDHIRSGDRRTDCIEWLRGGIPRVDARKRRLDGSTGRTVGMDIDQGVFIICGIEYTKV